ncbi:MAG: hypothetical protein IM631_12510 [Cytophagales bacterium]|nr:hypothetical protein [Cytophagales bacterium]MCA6382337.1 hypothetical protein [Cytophagales bacterium]
MSGERVPRKTKKKKLKFPMYIVSVSKNDQIILLEKVKTEIALGRGVVLKKKLYNDLKMLWRNLPSDIKEAWQNISDETEYLKQLFI